MITFTEEGSYKIASYIDELEAKRKEILDAGKDTADETDIPSMMDIASDIEFIGADTEGNYYNCFGVTDHYDADYPLSLYQGIDFRIDNAQNDENN